MKMITTHTTSKQAKQVKLTDYNGGGERRKERNKQISKQKQKRIFSGKPTKVLQQIQSTARMNHVE